MAKNKVLYGFSNTHFAFQDETTPGEYETPILIPGSVRFTPTVEGESYKFAADNMTYFSTFTNNGYTAEIELSLIPQEILAELLGWQIDSNGMLVELADAVSKPFALLFQIQGDQKNRRGVYYNCVASRPEQEATTVGDSIEVKTQVVNLTISPIEIDGKMVVHGVLELNDTNATEYNSFFTEVYKPTFAAV
ncbi:phage tail protein [Paenibacillus glycanilyticus]|uniref:major tail protein n=1 Tax=Paenibacillus glycanilyticus TaxID=126569 RepID=UPI002040E1E2|nr:major tail protein [Paenibacillus glycanilyticus]MCM3628803.1 phage tail protein [Paenibacillus glycanilyticus]